MEEGGLFRDAFSCDMNLTNYNLGRATFARSLMYEILEACPERFTQMQQERAAENKINKITEEQDNLNESGLI
jgi:hypothetical protein